MQQGSLFEDDVVVNPGRDAVPVLKVIGGKAPLTKAQKQFNKLVERLTGQRQELARWQSFRQAYHQLLAEEYQPLAARLRASRIVMAKLLDRAMEGHSLNRREQDKVRDILEQLLSDLLAEAGDPELVRLHDKYADVSFGEEQEDHLEILRALAGEAGVDVEAYAGDESPEELADWLDEQVRAARPESQPAPKLKKKTKVAEGGTRAVREIFRKLASELHPDRETDPAEQARKTELMQRVNQAYKAGDLLALLELQLSIEQIDSSALAGLAEERLRHYVHVLEEQSRRLRDELAECMAPFALGVGDSRPRKITPEAVRQALKEDVRGLKGMVRKVDADVALFRDIRQLKQSLRDYRIDYDDRF